MTRRLAALLALALPLALAAGARADATPLTTEGYLALREKLRRERPTDLQAKLACDALNGRPARLDAWVVNVRESGVVVLDMDRELLSLPDLEVHDMPVSESRHLSSGQHVELTGTVRGCSFLRTTGTLSLEVGDGHAAR